MIGEVIEAPDGRFTIDGEPDVRTDDYDLACYIADELHARGRLNVSPKENWVDKVGGLPDYIDRIAVHLVEKGHGPQPRNRHRGQRGQEPRFSGRGVQSRRGLGTQEGPSQGGQQEVTRSKGRTGRPYRRLRDSLRAQRGPCGICGGPIDYDAPWWRPESFSVDHIVPLVAGGAPLDRANVRAAHARCNRLRTYGAVELAGPAPAGGLQTSRAW